MSSVAPDILGPDFRAKTLRLPPDDEGDVIVTLVRYLPGGTVPSRQECRTRPAMLYVHGFVDYFFQRHLAISAFDHGFDFYAIDLRKYGRSLQFGQTANYVTSLAAHYEDLDAAVRQIMDRDGHERLVVMGHSMGGLLVPLWAKRRRGVAEALVLNSPWLDLNGTWFERVVATPALHALRFVAPRAVIPGLAPYYGEYLHDPERGGWDYRLDLKPTEGFAVRAAWISAIRRGHAEVKRGLHLTCPVLVCASDRTGPHQEWHDALDRTDSVLRVEDMARLAPRLGEDVTFAVIPGGIHDLALSPEPARSRYLRTVFDFLAAHGLGQREPTGPEQPTEPQQPTEPR